MLIFARCSFQWLQFRLEISNPIEDDRLCLLRVGYTVRLDFFLKRNKKEHGEVSERLEIMANQKAIGQVSYDTSGSLVLERENIDTYSSGLLLNDVTVRSTTKIYDFSLLRTSYSFSDPSLCRRGIPAFVIY
jgi:hypothetical protein